MDADHIVQLVVASAWALAAIVTAAVGLPVFMAGWRHRESEQTRREIVAYLAEGSITSEEARGLMSAVGGAHHQPAPHRLSSPNTNAVPETTLHQTAAQA